MAERLKLRGNLGGDPVVRYTAAGVELVTFRVAASEDVQRSGVHAAPTAWHACVVTGEAAATAGLLRKGSRVYLEGEYRTRRWNDRFGREHAVDELHVDVLRVPGAEPAATPSVRPASPLEAARAAGIFGSGENDQ